MHALVAVAIRSLIAALPLAIVPAAAHAGPPKPWPPAEGRGQLYVHFGEEHIDDADGATLLP